MKILIDMNLSPSWGKTLEESGIDVVHWSELGSASTPDPEIMAFAAANGLIILTNDLDFGAALATANRNKPSVVRFAAMTFGRSQLAHRCARPLSRCMQS